MQQVVVGCKGKERDTRAEEFRKIIGSIVILADPLSTSSLASLLGIPNEDVDKRLHRLHSVLSIPSDRNSPVRLLHLSFRDFLLDLEKQEESESWFCVDETKTHKMIAARCLELMSNCLVVVVEFSFIVVPGLMADDATYTKTQANLTWS